MKLREIVEASGDPPHVVGRKMQSAGRRVIPEEELRAVIESAASVADAAEQFGCSRSLVWKAMREYGIVARFAHRERDVGAVVGAAGAHRSVADRIHALGLRSEFLAAVRVVVDEFDVRTMQRSGRGVAPAGDGNGPVEAGTGSDAGVGSVVDERAVNGDADAVGNALPVLQDDQ